VCFSITPPGHISGEPPGEQSGDLGSSVGRSTPQARCVAVERGKVHAGTRPQPWVEPNRTRVEGVNVALEHELDQGNAESLSSTVLETTQSAGATIFSRACRRRWR
jgi:hypothetical protein